MTVTVTKPLLSLRAIEKSFGGVRALRAVDLDIKAGSITALLGENGAGKSTLMRILAGAETPDSGQINLGGRLIRPRTINEANVAGISIVFQELNLFPHLSVGANILSRHEPARFGIVNSREVNRRAQALLDRLGCTADVNTLVGNLSLADQQLVEIAKALSTDARVMILDEPNSALRPRETQRVLSVIRELRNDGVAVILVSHRLEEVFSVADEIAVLRAGSLIRRCAVNETSISEVISDMLIERTVPSRTPPKGRREIRSDGPRVILTDVAIPGRLTSASFQANSGEIVGLAGLEGAGHTAVLDILFGKTRARGSIVLPTGPAAPRSPAHAVRSGIAYVPSDRKRAGLMLQQSCEDNLAQVRYGALGRPLSLIKRADVRKRALHLKQELSIRMNEPQNPARTLSGGNQQKLVFGKWWSLRNQLVLLDDPTRGVDAGGKGEIHRLIVELASHGSIVLITSSDLLELADICDRVVVFSQQATVGTIEASNITPETLLTAINTGVLPTAA